ncbi:hypothetical protein ABZ470_23840 [Streptosporangium sp. NPDC020072]|uniref:DUF6197 family protein n=1 Tax=Streptosporangium sp. NPDC020072 TaxID=3154788 RepID=UPI003422F535
MTISDRLKKALSFLQENQWGKYHTRLREADGTYTYCAEGAIRWGAFSELARTDEHGHEHTPDGEGVSKAIRFMDRHAEEMAREMELSGAWGIDELYEFNDHGQTTRDDVIALFQRAITDAEAKEKATVA